VKRYIFCILLFGVFSGSANALEGVHYLLPKVTALVFDTNPDKKSPLYAVGVFYGYGFHSNLAIELEANVGVYKGDYASETGKGTFSSWNIGGFGVYRHPFYKSAYVKAKVGTALYHSEHLAPTASDADVRQDLQVVIGAGAGYTFASQIAIELEYLRIKESSHNLGIGLHYPF